MSRDSKDAQATATIETIAGMVGCSVATVSRVINNIEPVSKPMRMAIMQAMRETNYTPRKRIAARAETHDETSPALVDVLLHWRGELEHYSFAGGRISVDYVDNCSDMSSLPGTERIANPFFRAIIDGICAELPLWGLRPVLQATTDLFAPHIRRSLQEPSLKGIIVAGYPPERIDEFLSTLNRPAVLADIPARGGAPLITTDSRRGIELSFAHLHELGHRNIGFLWSDPNNPVYLERLESFRFCMSRAGLTVREDWIYRGSNQVAAAAVWARALLERGDYPTAFMSACDIPALGVLRAATELSIPVPQRLSILGFDDIDACSVVTPALSSIRVPAVEIGREAARQLVLQIRAERPAAGGRRVILEPELVVRSSTAPTAQ